MNNLLIDIGNSEIKTGIGSPGGIVRSIKRFPYSKNNFENDFVKQFESDKYPLYKKAGISMLQDEWKLFLEKYFLRTASLKPVFINRSIKLPLKINYSKSIGNDRICNAAAVHEIFNKKNILVIDFGTATTYTLVVNGILEGGMIAPGIKTSLNSLTDKTSLPEVKLSFPKVLINKNTANNIKAGVLFQSLYAVERVIMELNKKYKRLYVVATGGNSQLIAKETKLINKVDRELVLKGINIIISK